MALIIATGSNVGDPLKQLQEAERILSCGFQLVASSRVYVSKAVEYENQPDFFNQVLEFVQPDDSPQEVMQKLLEIEKQLGRNRIIPKGPRTIDLDIIFWGTENFNSDYLTIPHPRWMERSFVVKPLQELPFFQTIEKCFTIPKSFLIDATPI